MKTLWLRTADEVATEKESIVGPIVTGLHVVQISDAGLGRFAPQVIELGFIAHGSNGSVADR